MKKFTYFDHGHRGTLPPDLVPLIGDRSRAAATREFIDAMTQIAHEYHASVDSYKMTHADIARVKLHAPDIFGQRAKIDYIASGGQASVYKLTIGSAVYALKINRFPRTTAVDLEAMHLALAARKLINRPYVGATFQVENWTYSWVLMKYVPDDRPQDFDKAREKLFYAALTKGIHYFDMLPENVRDGKIIDLAGIYKESLELRRAEIDFVKKMAQKMRADDIEEFERLAQQAMTDFPQVLFHMAFVMEEFKSTIPHKIDKFRNIINHYIRQGGGRRLSRTR